MRGELDYYSSRSGLPAGTLSDHKFAYFKGVSGIPAGTTADHMAAFFSTQGKGSVLANMYAYYAAQSGTTGTLDDVEQAFFANPPSGGPVAGVAPVLTPTARTFSYNNVADNATLMTLTPNANTQLGDYIFAVITGTTTPGTVTPNNTGWTSVITKQVSGSMNTWVYYRVRGVGETTYGFTFDSGGGNVVGALIVAARGSAPIIGAGLNRAVDLTNVAQSITTTVNNTLALALSTERTTATETGLTSITAGWGTMGFAQQATPAIQTITAGYKTITPAGASGDCTLVYPNTQATNGWAMQVGIPPKALAARVTDIPTWAAQTDAYISHRGSSKSFPEMTKFAYDESVAYGSNAIEISVHKSASGTFWCNHDADLTAVTGGTNTNTILSQTDAQLASVVVTAGMTNNTSQVGQSLTKLSDVMAAYGDNVVIFIEDKTYANQASLITYLQTFPHWKERFVWKQAGTGTKYPIPVGMRSWGYFFDADAANFTAKQAQWDYVGLDFNSSDATLISEIATAGAPRVIGHIIFQSAQISRFQGFGVHKFMVSDISLVPAA